MHIRSFRLSDYGSVANLLKDALSEACYEETIEAFARQLSWDCDLVLVAADNKGQAIGMIIGTIDNNKGYYYRIAVAPGYRGNGIGKALIRGLQQRFNKRKVKRILVSVDSHNEFVLPVYESLGYGSNDFDRSSSRLQIVCG